MKPEKRYRCVVCGKAELQPRIRTERFDYEADGVEVAVVAENVPVSVCPACGETFGGPDAGRIRDEAICRAMGLMTPVEITGLRDELKMTQAELARLTGIGEASISRWERGQLIQSRAFDRYLRLLAADRSNVRRLKKISSPTARPAPPARARKRRTAARISRN